jgi:prolyl oligopeptidase
VAPDEPPAHARRAAPIQKIVPTMTVLLSRLRRLALAGACAASALAAWPAFAADDPYLWLEERRGERALAWVRERNAETRAQLEADPLFRPLRDQFVQALTARDRIPEVTRHGDALYNLWRDERNPRGLWRRTTLAEFLKREPAWETVLDVDALGAAENESWVFARANCLGPAHRRCLISLSRGGSDAVVVREFDTQRKRFVDDGFTLPEARSFVDWIDADTIYVATDFGPGTLTASGYPRQVKRLARGQSLAQARPVFEGRPDDVGSFVQVDRTPGHARTLFTRVIRGDDSELHLLRAGGRLELLPKPIDADATFWRERVLLRLRSDLADGEQRWPKGSLLIADADAFVAGRARWQALFTPTETRSLDGFALTRSQVLVLQLDNVASRLEAWRPVQGRWVGRTLRVPGPGTLKVKALADTTRRHDTLAEHFLLDYRDFLTPESLLLGRTGTPVLQTIKARAAHFDASGMKVEQQHATSKDGTRVPYFIVWPKGAGAGDGAHPTLLYGYGGFEVPMQPFYSAGVGRGWLARGGVFVLANVRGGGEFGPAWHQAALKTNRQRSFDDFIAVAEDLIARKVTTPYRLGIAGGSNGGLLVGAVMLQRPALFNAVVAQVPLLDMKRYHLLPTGASWMGEYGNPDDPADWAAIGAYSPYQNLRADRRLPKLLLTTSTRDDRVHPAHARKMAARMRELGHPVLLHEALEGGHAGGADALQRADTLALEYTFLWQQLGGADAKP